MGGLTSGWSPWIDACTTEPFALAVWRTGPLTVASNLRMCAFTSAAEPRMDAAGRCGGQAGFPDDTRIRQHDRHEVLLQTRGQRAYSIKFQPIGDAPMASATAATSPAQAAWKSPETAGIRTEQSEQCCFVAREKLGGFQPPLLLPYHTGCS